MQKLTGHESLFGPSDLDTYSSTVLLQYLLVPWILDPATMKKSLFLTYVGVLEYLRTVLYSGVLYYSVASYLPTVLSRV
jgi:hypothetical protein